MRISKGAYRKTNLRCSIGIVLGFSLKMRLILSCKLAAALNDNDLSPRAQKLIIEWAEQYRYQLLEMWFTKQIRKLPPLE